MAGRQTATPGGEKARQYIASQFADAGLTAFGASFEQPFSFSSDSVAVTGVNVTGFVPGTSESDLAIVISAHYDHLGVRDGVIYNGADDNGSGTSALLAFARHFGRNTPLHDVIFLAVDAEEAGLRGANVFVRDPPVPLETIVVNVNMDMVSHSDEILFVAGTHHYPVLLPYLNTVANRSSMTLRFGHDQPNLPAGDDWTNSSDHAPFHAAGIPFVYFGVEDHPDYHQPSDDFETINPDFFLAAVETMLDAVKELDRNLEAIHTR